MKYYNYKKRRVNTKKNILNETTFHKYYKTVVKNRCYDKNNNCDFFKYTRKQIVCDKKKLIQRIYKDPKSQCHKNDYNYRKNVQNKNGNFNSEYSYSTTNYLDRKKENMKNEVLIKQKAYNNKNVNFYFKKNITYPNKEFFTKKPLNLCENKYCNKTNWIEKSNKIKTASNYTQINSISINFLLMYYHKKIKIANKNHIFFFKTEAQNIFKLPTPCLTNICI